jgi:serine/threonine protein kinase
MACLLRLGLAPRKRHASDGSLGTIMPDHIGPYVIARRDDGSAWVLGSGAMGTTFRATDESLQRPVALKIINAVLGLRSAEARERFTREARAAGALRHPNVATVYQFGVREETGQFFYAMELVEGETLEERVRRLGPLDVVTTIDVAMQVTAALQAAEERGLVHRDLKPGNLMIVKAGSSKELKARRDRGARRERTAQRSAPTVKVIDFGVAKAVAEKRNAMALTHGGFVGTPAFASPEQFTNAAVDVRSDIYSLGATLWFALTGKTPFGGHSLEEICLAKKSNALPIEQLQAAHVPRRLRSLLRSMLAVEPAARPSTSDLAARLRRCAPQAVAMRRVRVAVAAAAIVILAASALLITYLWQTGHRPVATASNPAVPEKSIAVLPFENLSPDPNNAFFAEGIQSEILTRLSKIADLRVISRSSTQHYKSPPTNLAEIAKQLGVAHIL